MYVSQKMTSKFADVMKYLAAAKKAYYIVEEAELEKVAASQHHGGIVLLVASLTQRALTLGWALTIFIAGSLIISVVLKYLLSIKVYFKFT